MADSSKKKVTLQVGEHEIKFQVGITEFNDYQNSFVPGLNVVAPSENFLTACVDKGQAELLLDYCDQGLAIDLAQVLAGQFKPTVSISVKK